jgi:ribonuclease HII
MTSPPKAREEMADRKRKDQSDRTQERADRRRPAAEDRALPDISAMTIVQIREFVAGVRIEPGDALWEALSGDRRAGVRGIIESETRKLSRMARERSRLAALRRHERDLWDNGSARVAGVDEAGCGPLAGPVVAAAVVLDDGDIDGVNDSKKLTPERREELYDVIMSRALDVGVGRVPHTVIDRINILNAAREAMRLAMAGLDEPPDHVLVDGREVPGLPCPQTAIPRGDELSAPIAAASIIAKVTRDREMVELDAEYPGYGFARHKGYTTDDHLAALTRLGPCPIHRLSFGIVREASGGFSPAYIRFRKLLTAAVDAAELEAIGEGIRKVAEDLSEYELSRLRALYRRTAVRLEAGVGKRR